MPLGALRSRTILRFGGYNVMVVLIGNYFILHLLVD